jgi:hypothetical protein
LNYIHNNSVRRRLVGSTGVCVTTSLACHSEESAILIGGRRGISHGLENNQSEIPLPRLRDRNDRLVALSHRLPWGLGVVPPRRGDFTSQTTHPSFVWTGWIERRTRTCPFGTSQTPKDGGLRQPRPGQRRFVHLARCGCPPVRPDCRITELTEGVVKTRVKPGVKESGADDRNSVRNR